jgi:hypothetical protein
MFDAFFVIDKAIFDEYQIFGGMVFGKNSGRLLFEQMSHRENGLAASSGLGIRESSCNDLPVRGGKSQYYLMT